MGQEDEKTSSVISDDYMRAMTTEINDTQYSSSYSLL